MLMILEILILSRLLFTDRRDKIFLETVILTSSESVHLIQLIVVMILSKPYVWRSRSAPVLQPRFPKWSAPACFVYWAPSYYMRRQPHHFLCRFSKIDFPCGRLSWLPVSFLLHVKYPLSYRMWHCSAFHERLLATAILASEAERWQQRFM